MLTDGDYVCRMVPLPGDIYAVLREDKDGFGNIYINDQLSPMAKRRAFKHEIRHLMRGDMDKDADIRDIES